MTPPQREQLEKSNEAQKFDLKCILPKLKFYQEFVLLISTKMLKKKEKDMKLENFKMVSNKMLIK